VAPSIAVTPLASGAPNCDASAAIGVRAPRMDHSGVLRQAPCLTGALVRCAGGHENSAAALLTRPQGAAHNGQVLLPVARRRAALAIVAPDPVQ
jgi:hypothetical protein